MDDETYLDAWNEHQEAHSRNVATVANYGGTRVKRLKGSAFNRWYKSRERETIDQVREIMQEPHYFFAHSSTLAFRELELFQRAHRAAQIIVDFVDLSSRVSNGES